MKEKYIYAAWLFGGQLNITTTHNLDSKSLKVVSTLRYLMHAYQLLFYYFRHQSNFYLVFFVNSRFHEVVENSLNNPRRDIVALPLDIQLP